jgi:hypothetical protein
MADLRSLIDGAIAENSSLIIRVRLPDQSEAEYTVQPRGWDGAGRIFAYSLTDSEYQIVELSSMTYCRRMSTGEIWKVERVEDPSPHTSSIVASEAASNGASAPQTIGTPQRFAPLEASPGNSGGVPIRSSDGAENRYPRNGIPLRILLGVTIIVALFLLVMRFSSLDLRAGSNASPTAIRKLAPTAVDRAAADRLRAALCSAQHTKCFELEDGTVRLFRLDGSRFTVRTAPSLDAAAVTSTELAGVGELIARNAAGAWLQVRLWDGRSGWVFAPDVRADGDINSLPIVELFPTAVAGMDEPQFSRASSTKPPPAATKSVRKQIPASTREVTATSDKVDVNVQTSDEEPSVELDETVVSRILATQGAYDGAGVTPGLESADGASPTIEPIELPTSPPPDATMTSTPLPVARNCPRAEVCIVAPPSGAYRRYTDVYFLGTAMHPNFQRYKFEAINLASGEVGTVAEFWKPVSRGELMRFATFSMPPGRYTFRMIVIDNTGNSWPEIAEVDIELQ